MRITTIKNNQTIIEYSDGRTVFVSYSTPVAGYFPGRGWLRSAKRHSATTARHVAAWLRDSDPFDNAQEVPQAELDRLADE